MKKIILSLVSLFSLVPLFCVEFVKSAEPKNNAYVLYITPYDFAGCTDKIVLNAGKDILDSMVRASDFIVQVYNFSSNLIGNDAGIIRTERKVVKAYLSDGAGLPSVSTTSKFITLKLEVSPDDEYSSPFTNAKILNVDELYGYRILNKNLNITINRRSAVVSPEAAMCKTSSFTWEDDSSEIKMEYAQYVPPKSEDKKIPLIVFFHGIAESGRNISKPLFGIKSTALFQKKIQGYFGKDGAAVLLPQCPTGWLELTELDPFGNRLWVMADIRGPVNKFSRSISSFFSKAFAVPEAEIDVETPVSYYTLAVKELIDKMIEENPQIDTSRIYVGGCSAGGFMTVNMMIQYPDFFAAAFPICEAFPDARISNKDIEKLAKKPMWFTLAKTDEAIKPEKYTMPTVERLEKAGAENLHHVYFDKVTDTTGRYKNAEGTEPYEYNGHDSWIYVFNDEVFDGNLNLFDWLSKQVNGQ
jgi:predicted peptidase